MNLLIAPNHLPLSVRYLSSIQLRPPLHIKHCIHLSHTTTQPPPPPPPKLLSTKLCSQINRLFTDLEMWGVAVKGHFCFFGIILLSPLRSVRTVIYSKSDFIIASLKHCRLLSLLLLLLLLFDLLISVFSTTPIYFFPA